MRHWARVLSTRARPERRSGRIAAALLVVLCAPMLISSVALNMVSLAVLKPDSLAPELVDRALAVGRALAWGPLVARTANAAAGVAHARGDGAAELALLNEAAGAAPTDTSLAARLAELRLAQG